MKSMSKMNIAELAELYVQKNISRPGTVFTVSGAHFPDGTHHSIQQMRDRINQVTRKDAA